MSADDFKRDCALLRCMYKAERVEHQGKRYFIQAIRILNNGSPETSVYLAGNPNPIDPKNILLIAGTDAQSE